MDPSAWAAIAAGADSGSASGVLSFGLIWLDYLRRRERRLTVEGLALFLPRGKERSTCLRLLFLNPAVAQWHVFAYSEQGTAVKVDPRDFGNLDTRLEPCRSPGGEPATLACLAGFEGLERIPRSDGSLSLRVRGLEFARAGETAVHFGLSERVGWRSTMPARCSNWRPDLRSSARRCTATASILYIPVTRKPGWNRRCGPTSAGPCVASAAAGLQPGSGLRGRRSGHHGFGSGRSGRPPGCSGTEGDGRSSPAFQALDYWMRVKWHLDREEFTPSSVISRDSP